VIPTKKATKSLLTVVLAFILLLVNANIAFAIEIAYPGVKMSNPSLSDASAVITINFEDYFDMDEFNDYLVEQLKVTDCNSSNSYGYIDISHFNIPYSEQMSEELSTLIWYNSPELFRIYSLGLGRSSSTNTYTQLIFREYYSKEQYAEMHTEMVEAGEKLLAGIKGNEKLSDVDKALLLHDRIAITCQYDYDTYLNDYSNMPQSSYNAYGVLVLHDAVCMGYTLAYDYLLGEVGIKSDYCRSELLNHAWNIVYIDDKPYHVDVTWDDPTWDMSGRVKHTNFLRSTDGIKETDHHDNGTVDYITTPTDTTYDDYYWQDSITAFQLVDDEIYFFNTTEKTLYKLNNENGTDAESLLKIPGIWLGGAGKSQVMLVSDNENLYYSTPDTIYKYDIETKESTELYKVDLSTFAQYSCIYGLEYSDCKLTYVISVDNYYTSAEKLANSYSIDHHVPGEWVTIKEPTYEEYGEKQLSCKNCNIVLETKKIDILGKQSVTILENSVLDEENSIVFTGLDICKNAEDIFEFAENVTYNITPSITLNEIDFIGTGTFIEIYENEEKIAEYKIIVNGDLNGDSICDVIDASLAELALTKNRTPTTDECFAANGMVKEEIDIDSFQYVINTALG